MVRQTECKTPNKFEMSYCYLYWFLSRIAEFLGSNQSISRFKSGAMVGLILGLPLFNLYFWITSPFLPVEVLAKPVSFVCMMIIVLVTFLGFDHVMVRHQEKCIKVFESLDESVVVKMDMLTIVSILVIICCSMISMYYLSKFYP